MSILPDHISEQVDVISEEGNRLFDDGKFNDAIKKWKSALDILPTPQSDWEAATWLHASIGDAYYKIGAYDQAREHFYDALNSPGGLDNPFILYRLGQSLYELGDEEKSVEYLLRAYMLDGEDIFHFDEEEGDKFLSILRDKGVIS